MSKSVFPDTLTLLHNPRCSKSRAAKALLEERGVALRATPLPARASLEGRARRAVHASRHVAFRMGSPGEDDYKAAGLGNDATVAALLAAMAKLPVLIERPVLIAAKRAIVVVEQREGRCGPAVVIE